MDREDIERFLTERVQAGELKPCLVDTGLYRVALVIDGGQLKFFWYESTEQLDTLLRDSGVDA